MAKETLGGDVRTWQALPALPHSRRLALLHLRPKVKCLLYKTCPLGLALWV